MTEEKLLGAQLKRLLSGLSEHGNQHLTEVETDLLQTTILLSEAIEKLSTSFLAIHDSVRAQQNAIDMLLAENPVSPDIVEKLTAMQNDIGVHVNAAITGLQFQDMTSQLIARTVSRVVGLRTVLDVVGLTGSGMQPESDTATLALILDNINVAIGDQSRTLDQGLWKAVSQTHMESGSIDLF